MTVMTQRDLQGQLHIFSLGSKFVQPQPPPNRTKWIISKIFKAKKGADILTSNDIKRFSFQGTLFWWLVLLLWKHIGMSRWVENLHLGDFSVDFYVNFRRRNKRGTCGSPPNESVPGREKKNCRVTSCHIVSLFATLFVGIAKSISLLQILYWEWQ